MASVSQPRASHKTLGKFIIRVSHDRGSQIRRLARTHFGFDSSALPVCVLNVLLHFISKVMSQMIHLYRDVTATDRMGQDGDGCT